MNADVSPPAAEHWRQVYETKSPDAVSWHQPVPEPSLRALQRLAVSPAAALIDIGAGASLLTDELLARGYTDLTVLDIAAPALDVSRKRLGPRAELVRWIVADITVFRPERRYDVWHDRAVFHFLTDPEQRKAYRQALLAGTAPEAFVIMATFAIDGPERCSGLPVRRYDAAGLAVELGPDFAPVDAWREEHVTPWGAPQAFQWCVFRRS